MMIGRLRMEGRNPNPEDVTEMTLGDSPSWAHVSSFTTAKMQ